MSDFFSKIKDRLLMILSFIGAGILAFIGYKVVSQNNEIKELEEQKAQVEAENVTKEKQGELNVLKEQTKEAEIKLEETSTDYIANKLKLDELKRNRPK